MRITPTPGTSSPSNRHLIRYLQVVLSFEGLGAHPADVLALVTVRQFVLGQRRGISKHFAAHLQEEEPGTAAHGME